MAKILFIKSRENGIEFEFLKNGIFVVKSNYSIESQDGLKILFEKVDEFLENFFSVSWAKKAEEGYFFRFTNDKNEFAKIQNGEYTQSVNHADNSLERGISVSDDMSYCSLGAYKYFYKVSGEVIGRGSDGEPVLDAATMQKHSPYKSISSQCKKLKEKEDEIRGKFLEDYEWNDEQLRSIMEETSFHKCEKFYIDDSMRISRYSIWSMKPENLFENSMEILNFLKELKEF